MSNNTSRRALTKGIAWTVPVVATVGAAPAYAATGPKTKVSGSICQLFYGSGTINYQTHSIYLGITTDTGTIPKDTVLTWTICVSGGGAGTGGTNEVPTTNYSSNGMWTLSLSQTSGNAISGGCFDATITFTQDYVTGAGAGGTWCGPALIWTDIYSLRPGATITATSNAATGPSITAGAGGTLKYTAAKRYPSSINTTGRTPHYYTSKSGDQLCYPGVGFSQLLQSDGADDVVCYPSGTTITTTRCNWGGTTCSTSTTGLCTPPYKSAVSGQTDIPAMC